jgi:GTP pyrophosphokinase
VKLLGDVKPSDSTESRDERRGRNEPVFPASPQESATLEVLPWLTPRAQGLGIALHVDAVAHALSAVPEQALATMRAVEVLEATRTDAETRLAALLWPLASDPSMPEAIELKLPKALDWAPKGVVELLQGHAKARQVWPVYAAKAHTAASGAEGIRRLLLVLIKDVRVVLILLAEQLVLLRSLAKADAQTQAQAAQVTSDIHAPLANRLGVWQIKWELEDLAFRFLKPEIYQRIKELLDERRGNRESYISEFVRQLGAAMKGAGLAADVAGRPKHIFSIYKKMQKKGLEFSELYDVRAVRVIVADVASCYAALGAVHARFVPIPGEFDDYIANPKGNHYRSLHTAVIGPQDKSVEIQIRTQEMHDHAELGVAAHWRYKEGGGSNAEFERKINWMRQLLDARDGGEGAAPGDENALVAGFSTELLEDHVYLLTPKGQVLELPSRATVLDFAFMVHTSVGFRCRGAKVNGRIVPLTFQPRSGDQVEVLTGKEETPNRNWLDSQAGYLNTARARSKVRGYFNQLDLAQNLSAGRDMLERECKRMGLSELPLESLAGHFHIKKTDDFLIQIALGDLTLGQIARAVHELELERHGKSRAAAGAKKHAAPVESVVTSKLKQGVIKPLPKTSAKLHKDAVVVEGVGNLLVIMANCCRPLPGDAICGFITRGRGLAVHRSACKDLKHLATLEPERVIDVQWGSAPGQRFRLQVRITAFDRSGLLRDVGTVIAEAKVSILGSSTRVLPDDGIAEMDYTLEVNDFGQLSALLAKLRGLRNVLDARRI